MYEKVLVPLDGSKLAECSLPHVKNLAKHRLINEVTLLTVAEIPSSWVTESTDLMDMQQRQLLQGSQYLAQVQADLEANDIRTTVEVLAGRPDETIIDFAQANGINLIVIATHGYTGVKKWVFGSVALRVLHEAHVPVLLIRPDLHAVS